MNYERHHHYTTVWAWPAGLLETRQPSTCFYLHHRVYLQTTIKNVSKTVDLILTSSLLGYCPDASIFPREGHLDEVGGVILFK